METKLEHFKSGIIQELPLQIGVFPFGLIYGILAIESGLSILQTFLMSSIIFAGASQIVFAQFYLLVSPFSLITSIFLTSFFSLRATFLSLTITFCF